MAKLKFKNPKTGLWEEVGNTTYTAGTGISISNTNVISATNTGDVTAAGDNYFTGVNSFSETVGLDGGITVGTTGIECDGPINLKAIQVTARYIGGLVTPTSDDYAANKKYVDDGLKLKAGLSTDNTFTGANTFSGKVTVSTAPTADTDVATKKYVDNNISTCVPKNTVSSETWTFTLAGGSTVTKNIVLSSSL